MTLRIEFAIVMLACTYCLTGAFGSEIVLYFSGSGSEELCLRSATGEQIEVTLSAIGYGISFTGEESKQAFDNELYTSLDSRYVDLGAANSCGGNRPGQVLSLEPKPATELEPPVFTRYEFDNPGKSCVNCRFSAYEEPVTLSTSPKIMSPDVLWLKLARPNSAYPTEISFVSQNETYTLTLEACSE